VAWYGFADHLGQAEQRLKALNNDAEFVAVVEKHAALFPTEIAWYQRLG
jgi:hypothetical protein